MPKLKTAQRKTPRSEPYRKTRVNTPLSTQSHGSLTFPFLDLPFELRLIVYAYFLHMTPRYLPCLHLPLRSLPTTAEFQAGMADLPRSDVYHHAISKTRKSLNLVCRQISAEWSPLFYETTTSIVHASKRKLGYFKPKHIFYNPHCNPWIFANDFLRVLEPTKLASIKRIEYENQPGHLESFNDFPKLLMKHIDRLPSLERLTLHIRTYCLIEFGSLSGTVRLGDNPIDVWRTMTWRWNLEEAEEHFLGLGKKNRTLRAKKQGAGVLQGWNITRKLRAKHVFPDDRHLTIQGAAIVFRKHGPATTEQQPPSIKILFEG